MARVTDATSDLAERTGDAEAPSTAEPQPSSPSAGASTHAPLERRGSVFDDLWSRFTATPALARRTEWILLGAVLLLAALLRFVGLSHPGILVFDETFYVKDAWTLVNLGYEGKWPEGANDQWVAGNPNGYLTDPSYVVHPPFGKLVIGAGMLLFGADNPFGWRVSVAVVGTLAVAVLWLLARRLFDSPVLATIAAGMLAIDGHAIATSRVTILDGILMFFVLLGVWFVVLDRDHQKRQLADKILAWRRTEGPPEGRGDDGEPLPARPTPVWSTAHAPRRAPLGPDWGPTLWFRPWLVAAAVAFALASSVKWSGLFYLAIFCLYAVAVDVLERRRQGVTFWLSAGILKQAPVSFLLTVPVALAVYLATWTGWLTTEGGFYRNWAEQPGNAWTGALSWVPLNIQSLWHYSVEAYNFHSHLGAPHPFASSPLQWPFLIRPTAFSYVYQHPGDGSGCTGTSFCVEAITSISNPLIWWSGTIAIVFLLIMVFVQPRLRSGVVLLGFIAGYAPWLAYLERTAVFQFYAIVYLPYMILATVMVFRMIAGERDDSRGRRTGGIVAIGAVLVAYVLVSALFLPVWTGIMIPDWYWALTDWLPGWQ